jgi:post-segregation antitoxin (ccd killing protein)
MRIARVNVYLADELAKEARAAGLNISRLTQEAVRSALTRSRSNKWLDQLEALVTTGVSHDEVLAAVAAAKDEVEGRG